MRICPICNGEAKHTGCYNGHCETQMEEMRRDEQRRELEAEERRELEREAMEEYYRRHPQG